MELLLDIIISFASILHVSKYKLTDRSDKNRQKFTFRTFFISVSMVLHLFGQKAIKLIELIKREWDVKYS